MQGQSTTMNQPDDLLRERQRMWGSFTKVATYGTISIAVLLGLMGLFLV